MKLRPKVAEVVTHLKKMAASWVGLMPPCAQVENVASELKEPVSDSMQHCAFGNFAPPLYLSSSNCTGGLFQPSAALKSLTESQTTSVFSFPSIQSTQRPELSQEQPQEVFTKPFTGAQPESRVPMQLQPEESYDYIDLGAVIYPHLDERHNPLSSQLQKKRKGFKRIKAKLRELFSFGR
jgi:hypothetical protein